MTEQNDRRIVVCDSEERGLLRALFAGIDLADGPDMSAYTVWNIEVIDLPSSGSLLDELARYVYKLEHYGIAPEAGEEAPPERRFKRFDLQGGRHPVRPARKLRSR